MLFASPVDFFANSVQLLEVLQAYLDVLAVDPKIAEEALDCAVVAVLLEVVAVPGSAEQAASVVVRASCHGELVVQRLGVQDLGPEHDPVQLTTALAGQAVLRLIKELVPLL